VPERQVIVTLDKLFCRLGPRQRSHSHALVRWQGIAHPLCL